MTSVVLPPYSLLWSLKTTDGQHKSKEKWQTEWKIAIKYRSTADGLDYETGVMILFVKEGHDGELIWGVVAEWVKGRAKITMGVLTW